MSPLLAPLALLLACASAGPGTPPPASGPATVHRLEFAVSEEDECSQTLASGSTKGTLALELGADGAAALRLESEVHEFDLSKDDGKTWHGRQRNRIEWRGRAAVDGATQVIELELAGQRCMWLPLYGDGPATERPCSGFDGARGRLVLRCAAGSADVTQGTDRKAVAPSRHAALRCAALDPDTRVAVPGDRPRLPYVLDRLAEAGALVFPGAPLKLHYFRVGSDESRWFVDTSPGSPSTASNDTSGAPVSRTRGSVDGAS